MTITEQVELGLDNTDLGLIAALASGVAITDAAAQLGVSAPTAYRRQRKPGFRVALAQARALKWLPDAERFRTEVGKSLDALVSVRDAAATSAAVRVRASVSIVELALALHENVDVNARLEDVEAALAAKETPPLADVAATQPTPQPEIAQYSNKY